MFFFVIEAFGANAQPASSGCSTQRVWDYPNKHFAEQKWRLYIRTPCLHMQKCRNLIHVNLVGGHVHRNKNESKSIGIESTLFLSTFILI